MSLITHLIVKGSSVEAKNNAGQSGTDAVLSKGEPSFMLTLFAAFVYKSLSDSSIEISCMGRDDCNQKPEFLLYCPHRQPACKLCSKCLLTCENKKHRCPQENVTSIVPVGLQQLMNLSRIQAETQMAATISQPALTSFTFKWIQNGTSNGSLRDQMGNNYSWRGKAIHNSHDYRCDKGIKNYQDRCPAIARRFKNEEGTPSTFRLISAHNHHVAFRQRNTTEENRPEEGSAAGSSTA